MASPPMAFSLEEILGKLRDLFSPHSRTPSGAVEFIVAGLGNPGAKYDGTRHNAGFMALDYIAGKLGVKVSRLKYKALCGDAVIAGKRVLLLKPSTFMNNSGESVRDAMQFYKLPPENVLVLCDDISLDVGCVRIRRKGSDGGQKGLRSIITLTGSEDFPRVKIGVGAKPHPDMELAAWVLSKFSKDDGKKLEPVWDSVQQAVELIVSGDTDGAMNKFN